MINKERKKLQQHLKKCENIKYEKTMAILRYYVSQGDPYAEIILQYVTNYFSNIDTSTQLNCWGMLPSENNYEQTRYPNNILEIIYLYYSYRIMLKAFIRKKPLKREN